MSRKKKKQQQIPSNLENVSLGRRSFLKLAGISTAAALTLSIPFFLRQNEDYSFLESEILAKDKTSFEDAINNFKPIGPKRRIVNGTEEFEDIKSLLEYINGETQKYGITGKYDFTGIYQYFGIPESKEVLESYEKYFRRAVNLLYSKINGLRPIDLDFVLISDSTKSHQKDFDGKIFLVNSCYQLIYPKLFYQDTQTEPKLPFNLPIGIKPFSGGMHSRPEGHKPFVIGTVGKYALSIPFSEILPYTINELPSYIEYKKNAGSFSAAKLEEALEEGIAHSLMEENEIGVPSIEKYLSYISSGFESESGRYIYVNRAIKFIKNVGMQKAFDLFAESPSKFKQELEKT